MIVRFHGTLSGLSPSHVKAESMTTDFGMPAASLSVVGSKSSRGPPTWYEKMAKFTPSPSHVAPAGYGRPGQTLIETPWCTRRPSTGAGGEGRGARQTT